MKCTKTSVALMMSTIAAFTAVHAEPVSVSAGVQANSIVPVDIISQQQLLMSGESSLAQALSKLLPSFNLNIIPGAHQANQVTPASLRNMGADQVMVLVNGKRRHQSATLVSVNSIGRGSVVTDLNSIPLTSISKVEVLRDGAAAIYGSSAIAGVINIVLKSVGDDGVSLQYEKGDGGSRKVALTKGIDVDGGNVRFSAELTKTDPVFTVKDGSRSKLGTPDATSVYLYLESAVDVGYDGVLDLSVMLTSRDLVSGGEYIEPGDPMNNPYTHPFGSTPQVNGAQTDTSVSVIYKDYVGSIDYSSGVNYGISSNAYRSENVSNPSLQESSLNRYDVGSAESELSEIFFKGEGSSYEMFFDELQYEFGVTLFNETFTVTPGDPDTYANGGEDEANGFSVNPITGLIVLPGVIGTNYFNEQSIRDVSRDGVSVFLSTESYYGDSLKVDAAYRYEKIDGEIPANVAKVGLKHIVNDRLSLRASVSTGARAPSLAQRETDVFGYEYRGDVPLKVSILPESATQGLLDTSSLKVEKSFHQSFGFMARPNDKFTMTVDFFDIAVKDRIVLSAAIPQSFQPFPSLVSVFGNFVDVTTKGLDVDLQYNASLFNTDVIMGVKYNHTETTVTNAVANESGDFFPERFADFFENGQPEDRATGFVEFQWQRLKSYISFQYVSEYQDGLLYGQGQRFDGMTFINYSGMYDYNENVRLTFGVSNITDVTPEQLDSSNPYSELTDNLYSPEVSPVLINGRRWFVNYNYSF